jgi:LEA14-like dessication related protein
MKRFILIACLAAWAASVNALDFPKPTAEIKRFQVEAITLRDVTFLFDLAVKNPYPLGLSFKGMTLDFNVEGAKVFTTSSKGGFTVPANGQKSNTFTVTLTYEAVMKLVSAYASKDWLSTVINGVLIIPLPSIPGLPKDVSFKYSLSTKIPAIKPRLAIIDFTVKPPSLEQVGAGVTRAGKKVDAGKALGVIKNVLEGKMPSAPVIDPAQIDVPITVSFTLEIKNEAKGPLSFNALGYELYVNGDRLVAGESSKVVQQGDSYLVTVDNVFSTAKLTKNVKALFSSRKGSFGVKGSAQLKLPDEIRKEPIPLSFDESGSFSLK